MKSTEQHRLFRRVGGSTDLDDLTETVLPGVCVQVCAHWVV